MELAHKGIYLDNSALSPDNSVKLYLYEVTGISNTNTAP